MPMPDAEVVAVQWARNNPALTAIVGTRISTRVPKNPTFPLITVFRVSGAPDPGEAPLDQAQLQWDCYGQANGDASPDYASASLVARTLIEQIEKASGSTGNGTILGVDVTSGPRRQDEPTTGWARYIVETLVMTRSD